MDLDTGANESSDDSGSTATSLENLSESSLRYGLLSDALQYYSTIIPAFVAAVALLLLIWPSLRISTVALIIVTVTSGAVAAVSFIWRYFVRYNEEYATRLQEVIALQDLERVAREERALAQTRNTLAEGFSDIGSAEGLEALDRLTNEFQQVQAVLGRWSGASLVSIGQIPTLAQETYRQGLSLLTNVLEMSHAVHDSDQSELETRLVALEQEIQGLVRDGSQAERFEIRRKRLASYKDQLLLVRKHELHSEELLLRVNLSEAALNRTLIELASLKAESSEAGISSVNKSLQRTIDQAREVLEEMQGLGF